MNHITETIRALGINGTYLGFRYLVEAIEIVSQNEDILLSISTKLYPTIAELHHTTAVNVERNIRTVINACWERGNRAFLADIFPYPLKSKPSSGEMIDALTEYCKNQN